MGMMIAVSGVLALGWVVWLWLKQEGPQFGFGWIMAALLIFSGSQLVMLGLIGEYVGRMFLTINQRPQAVVREVVRSASRNLQTVGTTAGE